MPACLCVSAMRFLHDIDNQRCYLMAKTQDPKAELEALLAQLEAEKKKIKPARDKAQRRMEEEEETIQLCDELEEEEIMMSTAIKAKIKQMQKASAADVKPDAKLAGRVETWSGKVGKLKK